MNNFSDGHTTGLLNRVREDVSHLRDDLGNLLSYTTTQVLPNSARELAGQAKHHLAAGSAYASSRLRSFRAPPPRHSSAWIGSVVVGGIIAYGIYALLRNSCATKWAAEPEEKKAEGGLADI